MQYVLVAKRDKKSAERKRILMVTPEMHPYYEETHCGHVVWQLCSTAKHKGNYEVRAMMPRFGVINDRKHRLHEVVRLSGFTVCVGDSEYTLYIKVATLPEIRMQTYFIENKELFGGSAVFRDENGQFLPHNGLRMVFFAKSLLEIALKLGWAPDIVHCHGWFSALVPLYIKKVYRNYPVFKNSIVVSSVYEDFFPEQVNGHFTELVGISEEITPEDIAKLASGTYFALYSTALYYSDAIVKASNYIDPDLEACIMELGRQRPVLEFIDDDDRWMEAHLQFYSELTTEKV